MHLKHKQVQPVEPNYDVGTAGWDWTMLADLYLRTDEPFEITDGVLTRMPPFGTRTSRPHHRLRASLDRQLPEDAAEIYAETDLRLKDDRVARPDLVGLTAEQEARQLAEEQKVTADPEGFVPIVVTPELVVETVSKGQARRDEVTKFGWYQEAKIPYYFILRVKHKRVRCYVLRDGEYVLEVEGHGDEVIESSVFGGVKIDVGRVMRQTP